MSLLKYKIMMMITSCFWETPLIIFTYFLHLELPTTKLGDLIEKRVNNFLIKENYPGNVTIRVVSSCDKQVDVKAGMKSRFVQIEKKNLLGQF